MMVEGLKSKDFTNMTTFLAFFFGGDYQGWALYPELAKLLFIVSVLPVGSCSNERSFSTMKCAKTRLRSNLKDASLEHILIASIEGPDDDDAWGVALSNEQSDDIITLFRDLPDETGKKRERHILL
jgi:hypothetical protein